MPYGFGGGIRLKAWDFKGILSLLQPEEREQFLGTTWVVFGLPVAIGKDSLQEFLGQSNIHTLHTFRHGFRRTWIVRAQEQPIERIVYHDFGLAVIKEAASRRVHPSTERVRAPRSDLSVPRAQNTAVRIHAEAPSISVPTSVQPPAIPLDLENMMAAAIEAALKPMKERLEATIMPMQRTLESLQAEFVALRSEEKDDVINSNVAADAKRMRTGSDT